VQALFEKDGCHWNCSGLHLVLMGLGFREIKGNKMCRMWICIRWTLNLNPKPIETVCIHIPSLEERIMQAHAVMSQHWQIAFVLHVFVDVQAGGPQTCKKWNLCDSLSRAVFEEHFFHLVCRHLITKNHTFLFLNGNF
jgi:hypothetical protein